MLVSLSSGNGTVIDVNASIKQIDACVEEYRKESWWYDAKGLIKYLRHKGFKVTVYKIKHEVLF